MNRRTDEETEGVKKEGTWVVATHVYHLELFGTNSLTYL